MSWHPNDLVSDDDLLAYEPTILDQFGRATWEQKRQKALEDWLFPALLARGYDPDRLRTRHAPAAVVGQTSNVQVALGATDVALGGILAAPTDALYVGHARPFRGLSLRLEEAVSSATATAKVALWQDRWQEVLALGVPWPPQAALSRGGAVTWSVPGGWVPRSVQDAGPLYWARLSVTAALTPATVATQIAVIRRSLFCGPVTYQTLAFIFRAAPTSQDGPWDDRAVYYEGLAETTLQRALAHAGGEFDVNPADDVIDTTEAEQTPEEAGGSSAWTWERA